VAERDFSLLCRDRDMAAYGVVGAAQVAVAFLNLEENAKALKSLLAALETYQGANDAISQFHISQIQKKENSNGNTTRQSAA
jgi:hypothetical protein